MLRCRCSKLLRRGVVPSQCNGSRTAASVTSTHTHRGKNLWRPPPAPRTRRRQGRPGTSSRRPSWPQATTGAPSSCRRLARRAQNDPRLRLARLPRVADRRAPAAVVRPCRGWMLCVSGRHAALSLQQFAAKRRRALAMQRLPDRRFRNVYTHTQGGKPMVPAASGFCCTRSFLPAS
jgi:hypothetical protein